MKTQGPVEPLYVVTELPPSTNKLYQRTRSGGLALTKEAKAFRERLRKEIIAHLPQLSGFPLDQETIYRFDVYLYLKELENKGWYQVCSTGKDKGKRKAATRYKRIDVDNRIKFLQDSVMSALGVDDSQVFAGYQEKREDPTDPRAEVALHVLPEAQFFPGKEQDGNHPRHPDRPG